MRASVRVLYSIRNGQLAQIPLLCWLEGLPIDEPIWAASSFTKNCDLLRQARKLQHRVRKTTKAQAFLHEHFSLDGMLTEIQEQWP